MIKEEIMKTMQELIVEGHKLLERKKTEWNKDLEDFVCELERKKVFWIEDLEDEYDGKYDDLREWLGYLHNEYARKCEDLRTSTIKASIEKFKEYGLVECVGGLNGEVNELKSELKRLADELKEHTHKGGNNNV